MCCREMWAFANNDDIRAAIHAEPISKIGRFDECSDRITYTHDTGSMIPIHADLVSKGKGSFSGFTVIFGKISIVCHVHAFICTVQKGVLQGSAPH